MANVANIIEITRRQPPLSQFFVTDRIIRPEAVRLIPGSLTSASWKKPSRSVTSARVRNLELGKARGKFSIGGFLPDAFSKFSPTMLGVAMLDFALLMTIFAVGRTVSGRSTISLPASGFFVACFLLFALQEGVYSGGCKSTQSGCRSVLKALFWAAAIFCWALRPTSVQAFAWLMVIFGLVACALCLARWLWSALKQPGDALTRRNVLVVGDKILGRTAIDVLRSDPQSKCWVKRFIPDHLAHDVCWPVTLKVIARQECIDEVIVATRDVEAARNAIQEARLNQLDVQIMPDLTGETAAEMQQIGGHVFLKIHQHDVPEWTLAIKRLADFLFAAAGMVVVSPLLLLIAMLIKLDSRGPVLYRAIRIGRKGQQFTCYKFRTMFPRADAAKDSLRSRNNRDGAFFKVLDDPRITRLGRVLRRYSLDELPQLWNVFLGDMSLVGPRPHPPDDVNRYKVEHLQRLDFVPGITGLWQVTARQDPSFERCVALDVEYITRWSLGLDFRILWRTVSAVLQGSGV